MEGITAVRSVKSELRANAACRASGGGGVPRRRFTASRYGECWCSGGASGVCVTAARMRRQAFMPARSARYHMSQETPSVFTRPVGA